MGSSGLEPLPKGPDLQSGCRIRTTFTTQFLYLERESNPRHFRVKEIRSHYAIEAKCMFLNFLLINIQTKYILYPRQELNLTPLVKSQLPTPVCYEGEFGGHRFIIYSWVSTEPVWGDSRIRTHVTDFADLRLSHSAISPFFVGIRGFEPLLKQSKCFVLTVTLYPNNILYLTTDYHNYGETPDSYSGVVLLTRGLHH